MTSPTDELKQLLEDATPTDHYGRLVDRDGAEEWLSLHGAAVVALLDAAQIGHDELDDAIKANVSAEWDQEDYDRWDAARAALAAAVNQLTKEPT